ncbi:hypothetical protein BKA62DRAFT_792252 [Auriculariales sp. MPI-PUGE-AT-0066]|nr:hypothetical protein BKA62DRAFT_792252 [Auriculariales sp. MPI-PUGE-AT-0066]
MWMSKRSKMRDKTVRSKDKAQRRSPLLEIVLADDRSQWSDPRGTQGSGLWEAQEWGARLKASASGARWYSLECCAHTAVVGEKAAPATIILWVMHYIPFLRLRVSTRDEMLGIDDAEMGEFAYDYVGIERDLPIAKMVPPIADGPDLNSG